VPRVVHFEIQADDVDRAKKFYGDVFGWTFKDWDMGDFKYTVVMTAPDGSKEVGINGGLYKRPSPAKFEKGGVAAYICTIDVDDCDAIVAKVKSAGGKVIMEPSDMKDVGRLAQCLDTEGNLFGLIQPDLAMMPKAA